MSNRQRIISISHLEGLMEKIVFVSFFDGRLIEGILQNYDDKFNLYLTECKEHIYDINNKTKFTGETRTLGELFCKGNSILDVSLKEGFIPLEN